jgi:hypothetical protein
VCPLDDFGGETVLKGPRIRSVALDRVRQRGRKQRRFASIELARTFVEVVLRRGFNAEEPVAPLGDVEVDLRGVRLRPNLARNKRDADLDALAND